MEKYHGFFTYVGETSRYQVYQFNHGDRKSITLKTGAKFARFKNGHSDCQQSQTNEDLRVRVR